MKEEVYAEADRIQKEINRVEFEMSEIKSGQSFVSRAIHGEHRLNECEIKEAMKNYYEAKLAELKKQFEEL